MYIDQFQLNPLYNLFGKLLYTVPLEIGGLPKNNMLLYSSTNSIQQVLDNYNYDKDQGRFSMSFLENSMKEDYCEEVDIMKNTMLKMSRGGIFYLGRSEKRDKRQFREFLMNLPKDYYSSILIRGKRENLMTVLMNCMTRQESRECNELSSQRFCTLQIPYKTELFRPRGIWKYLTKKENISKRDLVDIIIL
jgi:hypothetical protein